MIFFIPMSYTSLIINSYRIEGTWNRTLLSGVQISDIILATMTQSVIVSIIQTVQFMISIYFELSFEFTKDSWLLVLLSFVMANLGFIFGFLLSACSDDFHVVYGIGIVMSWIMITLSGFYWYFFYFI
jgi:hypothetical protein